MQQVAKGSDSKSRWSMSGSHCVFMQLNLGHVVVNNMQKAKPKLHCSEFVKIRGGGLAFSYLLDGNSDNETKRNETIIN